MSGLPQRFAHGRGAFAARDRAVAAEADPAAGDGEGALAVPLAGGDGGPQQAYLGQP